MFARKCVLSLALPFFLRAVGALQLDASNKDSIKLAAKTIAGGVVAAYNAALDSDRIEGLFGDDYYFWEAGAIWNGLIDYSFLTGDSQYDSLILEAITHQLSPTNNFMPPNQTKTLGNDDQSFWALAAVTAAEVGFKKPEGGDWVDFAEAVFNDQVLRWDEETCNGGLRWQIFTFNNGYNYKNTVSSGNLFLLSARLAQFTGNATYSEWASKVFKWTRDVGLVSEDYAVYDGTDVTTDCSQVNHIQWSYVTATFMEAAALMYNSSNGESSWKEAVTGLVNASSVFQYEDSSILYEVACESNGNCDTDQKAFKGIAANSLARAALSAPFTSSSLRPVLEASAKGAAAACSNEGKDLACGLGWNEDSSDMPSVTDGGLSEAFSALGGVQALLYSQTGALAVGNSTSPGNATQSPSGSPSRTTGADAPENTGAAGRLAVAWSVVLSAAILLAVGL